MTTNNELCDHKPRDRDTHVAQTDVRKAREPLRQQHSMENVRAVRLLNPKANSYAVGFRQSKTALLDWTFCRPDSSGPHSYRQPSPFFFFLVLFSEAVGVREY